MKAPNALRQDKRSPMGANRFLDFSSMALCRRSAIRFGLALGAAIAIVLPHAAMASGPPLIVHEDVDFTIPRPLLSGICGYEVFARFEGNVTTVVHFDDAGRPIREVDTGVLMQTFFAPSTGQSVSFPLTVNFFTDYFPDGTAIAKATGMFLNIHTQGAPPLRFAAGREVYSAVIVDVRPDGVPIVELIDLLAKSGTDRGTLAAICTALDA